MGKESKASSLKPEQKVIVLRSVAQYLERCGFSKCFKKLLSEAQIEKKELNSSLPGLDEVFCEFFNKSRTEAVEVKESGGDNEDRKKKAASADENASDDHEKDEMKEVAEVSAMEGVEKVKKEKKKKKKEAKEEEKVKETDALIEDGEKEKKKKKKNKSKSSEAESLVDDDGKEKSSKKRKRSEPEETKEQTEEDVEESKRRKKEESVVEETPVKQADVQENGNVEKSEKKSEKGLSNSKEPKKPFQRVNVEEIIFTDDRLKDNSYWAKDGADSGYGAKAQEVLGQVRGRGFRHEKTKKKRGSYRGGEIDLQSHSVKFEYSDDE
ncbi:hypothetical protein N665_0198s0315 [Sinapis alba]|nr:hypothetical protein N665_0198s0315 [Sinapis alba]